LRHPDDPNKVRVFLKGAPEIVIGTCTKYFNEAGEEVELTDKKKD
jgi:magnesium-transporting ATPase (P-type)